MEKLVYKAYNTAYAILRKNDFQRQTERNSEMFHDEQFKIQSTCTRLSGLRPPEIVFRKPYCSATKKSRAYCVGDIEKIVLFPSQEYAGRSKTFFSLFCTPFPPDVFVAEHYGLRNTIFWWSKDYLFDHNKLHYN
jgi:hypothetical protein